MTREFRPRARQVCVRCHERKVRCDLQSQSNGTCGNCAREGYSCRQHVGSRKKRPNASLNWPAEPKAPLSKSISSKPVFADNQAYGCPVDKEAQSPQPSECSITEQSEAISPSTSDYRGSIGSQPVISLSPESPCTSSASELSSMIPSTDIDAVYQTRASWPSPSDALSQALIESYLQYLYPHCPVISDADVSSSNSSQLLRQTLYFGGSLMRQSKYYPGDMTPKDFFLRIKVLLFLEQDRDVFAVLKSLCILSCWSYQSPTDASINCPWQWTGSAIRLAIQLGLHKEATHVQLTRRSSARRIWWFLLFNETIQSLCYARPPMTRYIDHDVKFPEPADFEAANVDAFAFCFKSRLLEVMNEVEHFRNRGRIPTKEKIVQLLRILQNWVETLPDELLLFNADSSPRPYSKIVHELHIIFQVTIILVYLLPGAHQQQRDFCAAATAASSCIYRLYEDIFHRSDTNRLISIHSWFILIAFVPHLYCSQTLALYGHPVIAQEATSTLCKAILEQMAEKYISARWIIKRIESFPPRLSLTSASSGPVFTPPASDSAAANLRPANNDDAQWQFSREHTFDFRSLFQIPDAFCPALTSLKRIFHMDFNDDHNDAMHIILSQLDSNDNSGSGFPWPELSFDIPENLFEFPSATGHWDI